MDLPPTEIHQPIAIENRCVVAASAYYNLPPEVIVAIRIQEGGQTGRVSRNVNKSVDMGPMQINSIHEATFNRHGISKQDLINNECTNLFAGGYILARELVAANGDLWRAVGNYHSRTPTFHNRYRNAVAHRVRRLYERYGAYVQYLRQQAAALRMHYLQSGTLPPGGG